eukprot:4423280-Amphidinium_carterae.2
MQTDVQKVGMILGCLSQPLARVMERTGDLADLLANLPGQADTSTAMFDDRQMVPCSQHTAPERMRVMIGNDETKPTYNRTCKSAAPM